MTRKELEQIDHNFSHNLQTVLDCQGRWYDTFGDDEGFEFERTAVLVYNESEQS